MWRLPIGSPSRATRSQAIVPVRLSIAYTVQRWRDRSSDASPSPYRPGRNVAFGVLLTPLVTKTRSPHTTGRECARPGIGVRHRALSLPAGALPRALEGGPARTLEREGPVATEPHGEAAELQRSGRQRCPLLSDNRLNRREHRRHEDDLETGMAHG